LKAHELLDHINPSALSYQDWLNVGMALKHEGASLALWEQWSQRDTGRYVQGECARKWAGFHGSTTPVTAGTLVAFAKQQGWVPERRESEPGRAYDWDEVVSRKATDHVIIEPEWVEEAEVTAVKEPGWRQLQIYLETLFEASDIVGYCCEAWQKDDKWLPSKGVFHRSAGQLIADLERYKEVGPALGDYKQEVGAWIRFNPLDGQGVNNANVVGFRYTLVECDEWEIEKQAAIYKELELPIVALVHSGRRSLHAIVHIDASSYEEYRTRVNYLFDILKKNGVEDKAKANRNPSRLSRMPGVMRNGVEQSLVAINQGKQSFTEWKDWIEEQNDSLPDIEPLDTVWNNLPELAPPLIDNVVRRGHKMLLSGPSKAGKSYMLLELVVAIAEGGKWLGWQCEKGRVLYVNLELDKASCFQRLKSIYQAFDTKPANLANIDIWNLRGKAVPMDRLAPMLIRRAMKRNYAAIILDPIYKVITGDENAADKMAFFCNQFDRLCTELGCAVFYCHHHSKGAQGQKSSRDRSSGSGVFARDPDAILDLIQLNLERSHLDVLENIYLCPVIESFLNQHAPDWKQSIGQDAAIVASKFLAEAYPLLSADATARLTALVASERTRIAQFSGWRLEGTLREFPPFPEREILFTYPIHVDAPNDILRTAKADGEEAPWVASTRDKRNANKQEKQGLRESLLSAHSILSGFDNDQVLLGDMADHMGVTPATLKKRIAQTRALIIGDDNVVRTKEQADRVATAAAVDKCRDVTGQVKLPDVAAALGLSERAVRNRLDKDDRYIVINNLVTTKEEA
jgi:hypothetical protein